MEFADKIHIKLIPDDKFSLNEFVNDMADNLEKESILLVGTFPKGASDGTFENNCWVMERSESKTYCYINFAELNLPDNEDILLIKCWVAEFLINGYVPDTIPTKYSNLARFLKETDNFSSEFLQRNKGNSMEFLIRRDVSEPYIHGTVTDILNYIYFREESGFKINTNVIGEYLAGLEALYGNLNAISSIRDIPNNSDALRFGFYIDLFFKDSSIPQDLKTFYMPILLWWKIGNIIPIRPVELCTKMERNCLVEKGNNFYIKINRSKSSKIIKKTKKRAYLPILDKLQISKEAFDLISDYIDLTNIYGESKTLFSYRATVNLRLRLSNIYPFMGRNINDYMNRKINLDYYTTVILRQLLSSFYKNIIKDYYKDVLIEEFLRLHDLRHYAFTSLMLQGLTPVEIALIGGHKTVRSQMDYQCNVSYYIDNEIVNFLNAKKLDGEFSNKTIKKIVLTMPKECPKPLDQCLKTEDNIGYCTSDFNNGEILCDNEEFCFKCKQWWCAPTEQNYDLLRYYINEVFIIPLEKMVTNEEHYLIHLISKMNPVNLDGELRADVDQDLEYKTSYIGFKSDIDKLIDLKKILLDIKNNEQDEKNN